MKQTYTHVLRMIETYKEENLMATREGWGEGKTEWVNGQEIWTPVCILKENGEIKYQNADGVITPYTPTEEDKQATDWFII